MFVVRSSSRTIPLAAALLVASLSIPLAAQSTASSTGANAQIAQNYGKLPLSFEANQGQTDAQVKFLSQGSGYSLLLTDSAAILSLSKGIAHAPLAKPADVAREGGGTGRGGAGGVRRPGERRGGRRGVPRGGGVVVPQ